MSRSDNRARSSVSGRGSDCGAGRRTFGFAVVVLFLLILGLLLGLCRGWWCLRGRCLG
jgi:hypothetical protein